MTMVDFRARTLPIVVEDVPEGDTQATVKMLEVNGPAITVSPGGELPGASLTVESVKHRVISSKRSPGRLVDVSEVRLHETATGRRILAVKGLPVMTAEACGFVRMPGAEGILELRRGDEFRPGDLPLRVVEVKPLRIVLERTDTKETASVVRLAAE
jgi:hypothetical protein